MNAKHRQLYGDASAALWWTLVLIFSLATGLARAETNTVVVQSESVTNVVEAYAQVEPIALLPIRPAQSGVVRALAVTPGSTVQAGQALAEIDGPEIQALLAQDETTVTTAQTNLIAAQKTLEIQQGQLASHLVTHQMILQAEGTVAQAQSAFDTAQAQLQALRQTITLKAPADGTVLSVSAADGERVSAGDTILTLQATGKLWVKAAYYGSDAVAIQTGMTGQFIPTDGSEPIAVKVCAVFGAMTSDGGEGVGLLPVVSAPKWLSGESGTVKLNGEVQSLAMIPTRALILDQGQWWVLVHKGDTNYPQAVTPGQARGWQTSIKHGLDAGTQVVVANAYLEFHQGISDSYQPPD